MQQYGQYASTNIKKILLVEDLTQWSQNLE